MFRGAKAMSFFVIVFLKMENIVQNFPINLKEFLYLQAYVYVNFLTDYRVKKYQINYMEPERTKTRNKRWSKCTFTYFPRGYILIISFLQSVVTVK